MAEPEDACGPLAAPSVQEDWIALIVRSEARQTNCSFDVKASAGLELGSLFFLASWALLSTAFQSQARSSIPAVFINQNSGLVLKKLVAPGTTIVTITPVRHSDMHLL